MPGWSADAEITEGAFDTENDASQERGLEGGVHAVVIPQDFSGR
jgi:hypothetical protein